MSKFVITIFIILSFSPVRFYISSLPTSEGRILYRKFENFPCCKSHPPPPFYHPPPPTRPFICSSIFPIGMPSTGKWIFNIAGVTFRLSQIKLCYFRTYKCRIFNFLVTYFQFPGHSNQSVQTHEAEEKLLPFIQRSWSDILDIMAVLVLR
jgi:hypothetical protein